MDNMGDSPNNLVHELLQGLELVRQLRMNLHMPSSSSSSTNESSDMLIQKIILIFEKVLDMVNLKGGTLSESSSPLLSCSPQCEGYNRDLRDQDHNPSRKRKTLPKWTKIIKVNPEMGVEAPLDDGYSWRKYGQKDILGALYPRGYYKCSHRNVQGCLATKQVQRSDKDPTMFEISYRGKHTCTMASSTIPNENQESNLDMIPHQQHNNILQSLEQQPNPNDQSFASFHFPSISNMRPENQILPSPMVENFTSSSGISQFSISQSLESSEFQMNDMDSAAATSAANSATIGLEFPFDQFDELDGHDFIFDNPPFF